MSVRNPLIEWEVLRVARELIELHARTRIVAEITGLSPTKARAMYRARHGRTQTAGNMTTSVKSFVSTPMRRLHASLICGLHRWFAKHRGTRDADTLLGAYRLYGRICRGQGIEALFDINCVYRVIRLLGCGRLVLTRCQRCDCDFVRDPDEDWNRRGRSKRSICPACELLTGSPGRRDESKWAVSPHWRADRAGSLHRTAGVSFAPPFAPIGRAS